MAKRRNAVQAICDITDGTAEPPARPAHSHKNTRQMRDKFRMTNSESPVVGFIGAGQMARALAGGFVEKNILPAGSIIAADAKEEAVIGFCERIAGARTAPSNVALVTAADVVFLAVKPQNMADVFAELKSATDQAASIASTLFVSIVAGLRSDRLADALSTERIVRVMPNTPCLIGQGMSAYAARAGVSAEDVAFVQRLLESVGDAVAIDESQLDAVTGLSGSGPAFVYQVLEAMIEGGIESGLDAEIANRLAVQTVLGAAMMLRETGETPKILTDRVASPNGTTVAGLRVLAENQAKSAITAAVLAATDRSRELAAG